MHATTHTTILHLRFNFTHTSFLYVLLALLKKTIFASRRIPEKVLSMKNMAFYINVNTDQRPKSTIVSQKQYTGIYNT